MEQEEVEKQTTARVRPSTKVLVTREKLGNETFDDTVRRIVSGFPELVDHIDDLVSYNRRLVENGEVAQSLENNAKKLRAVKIREIDIERLSDYAIKDGESPASILSRVLNEYSQLHAEVAEAVGEVDCLQQLRDDELREKNTKINRLTNRLNQIDKMFEGAGYRPVGETSRPQEYKHIMIVEVEQL